jgi:hypothetical protein
MKLSKFKRNAARQIANGDAGRQSVPIASDAIRRCGIMTQTLWSVFPISAVIRRKLPAWLRRDRFAPSISMAVNPFWG